MKLGTPSPCMPWRKASKGDALKRWYLELVGTFLFFSADSRRPQARPARPARPGPEFCSFCGQREQSLGVAPILRESSKHRSQRGLGPDRSQVLRIQEADMPLSGRYLRNLRSSCSPSLQSDRGSFPSSTESDSDLSCGERLGLPRLWSSCTEALSQS